MSSSTAGIKLDAATRQRIKLAAGSLDRTPHWFMKKAVLFWLDSVENGSGAAQMLVDSDLEADDLHNSVRNRERRVNLD